ncbi:hypothetical protein ABZ070_22165, partial [Streptomyces sp. NPDC006283]|uniref:hypothetical protein n=1 Tax=Streptomyces sp. NPDC006283 TaxID=3156741 RepID=UPI0033B85577
MNAAGSPSGRGRAVAVAAGRMRRGRCPGARAARPEPCGLAGDKFPDVVELGNTETMTYILNGALGEIDPS